MYRHNINLNYNKKKKISNKRIWLKYKYIYYVKIQNGYRGTACVYELWFVVYWFFFFVFDRWKVCYRVRIATNLRYARRSHGDDDNRLTCDSCVGQARASSRYGFDDDDDDESTDPNGNVSLACEISLTDSRTRKTNAQQRRLSIRRRECDIADECIRLPTVRFRNLLRRVYIFVFPVQIIHTRGKNPKLGG